MAERTNKPKPEDERPVGQETGSEPGKENARPPSSVSMGGAAVKAAYDHGEPTSTPVECAGGLRVTTVNVDGADEQPLSGVTVIVDSITGEPFSEYAVTDAAGIVEFTLQSASYNVRFIAPVGFSPESIPAGPFTVGSGLTLVVRAEYTVLESEVKGVLFHDVEGAGMPGNQPRVEGKVEFYDRKGAFLGCARTGDDGVFSHTFKQTDSVEIRLQQSYSSYGITLQPRFPAGLYAQLTPGSCVNYPIPLYAPRAEVVVAASLIQNGVYVPLIGARFLLHRGTDLSSPPLSADVYNGQAIRWTNLDADLHTITALPPDTPSGRRMTATHPRDGIMHTQLLAGINDLRNHFTFELCSERIRARLVKDACGSPLAGVSIDFIDESAGTISTATTGVDGIAALDASPVIYTVRTSTQKFPAEGTHWISDGAGVRVDMRNFDPARGAAIIRAAKDEHSVRCVIQDAEGNPRAFAAIEILDEFGTKLKDANTNAEGQLRELLPAAGRYSLIVRPHLQRVSFETHSEVDLGVIRIGGAGFAGNNPPGGVNRVAESFAELTSYPLLTESGGGGGAAAGRQRRPSGVSSASTSALSYTVDGAIREVLGWRPKSGDIKGFTEALTRSFESKDVGGYTEWSWTPRAAALVVDSELGAITGAQKSIYERGKVAFDQAAPKLDALYPLRNDADPQNCDAVRFIVRTAFEDLVREFGQSGGPRVQLVDDKFNLLLGTSNLAVTEQLDPACQLAILRDRFGLRRNSVNTIAEEENLTNFLIVVDHLKSLRITWNNNVQFFDRSGVDPFLGTQLVLLSRALGNVAEGVDEVRYVLSTVLLDEAEQQTIVIEYPGQTPLFVSELLNWIEHVATVEGPQLLTESGKDGAGALRGTLDLLRGLVSGAQNPPNTVPSAYKTTRVQRALQELALALQDAAKLSTIQGVV